MNAVIMTTGWQPIETAPKDGRYVLIYQPGKPVSRAVGRWRPGWNGWFASPGTYGWDPTHWMPLPDVPIIEGKA